MERMLEIPVSVNPTDAIRAMRIIGEENDWKMNRIEETKIVQRWAIIVPMANRARVLGLVVNSGEVEGLALRSWSHVAGSAGRMSFVEFRVPERLDRKSWRAFLHKWSELMPRCPWRWSFIERSIVGFLLPEFRQSRKRFANEGIDTSNWKNDD
ncbi:MAG TPA: hypothetical protein QF703_02180 [Candidatus Thalassarchaeaceae archaeon]|nr:hypothetical protein [Candidatus Thalassarchaeaceae archaeon]